MIRPNTPHRARVLILDADRHVRAALAERLTLDGFDVTATSVLSDALAIIADGSVDLGLIDPDLPAGRMAETIGELKRRSADTAFVIMSGYGSPEAARDAMLAGAAEFVVKPIDDVSLSETLDRVLRQQALRLDGRPARPAGHANGLIGQDPKMRQLFDTVDAVANTRTNVLILGESGTGKSLLARAVHAQSSRAAKPFVEVACGSLPDTLLESELFGHVKGGFTGAVADKAGRFVSADGGTIFLDEINSAPPLMQVKLLRVLQERRLEPVGSDTTRQVDVRTILASNADLQAMVNAGTFRQDLFYRINVVTVRLPALRDRPGDIPLLAEAFLERFVAESNRRVLGFTSAAQRRLAEHAWPGNVRELENAVERAVVLGRRPLVDADDLPDTVGTSPRVSPAEPTADAPALPLALALEGPEKRIIEHALARNAWNRNATAAELEINRTTLYKKMRKYGLEIAERGRLAETAFFG